jgi:hypothetical protein
MDPNGFEVGDKCENGPQLGEPLGYALNGSPYNQAINGHHYLIQAMWSNVATGCVLRAPSGAPPARPASVSLSQFSSRVSGDIGRRQGGIGVGVELVRADQEVAVAISRTRADGRWGPVALQADGAHARHAFGDDRDAILVVYGRGGPSPDEILTGSGGNPFTQSGYTGWYSLDTGYRVDRHYVLISPCSQIGVLTLHGAGATIPPIVRCGTESGVSKVPTRPLSAASRLSLTSSDNRAPSADNPFGALIALTVPFGETGSVAAAANDQVLLLPGGFPSCTADLRAQSVSCSGLVPGARYRLLRRRGHAAVAVRADFGGVASFPRLRGRPAITGGDALTLRNRAGRTLTTLHVAHLRVAIDDRQTVLAGGRCEPGDYYGRPLHTQPTSGAVGDGGVSDTGTICPNSGRAGGLPSSPIEQTDDLSGGLTRTAVPLLQGTSPGNDATVSGGFVALAETGLPTATRGVYAGGAPVSLEIRRAGAAVFRATNVDTSQGVRVPALAAGVYAARWVVRDANGDTRTVRTRFISAG